MGFSFNGIHSDTYNMAVETVSMPNVASMRSESFSVPGRNGQYVVEDGYDNKVIEYLCTIHNDDLEQRRYTMRDIVAWLTNLGEGELIRDDEPGKLYRVVKSVNDLPSEFEYSIKTESFTLLLECLPFQGDVKDWSDVPMDELIIPWDQITWPWDGQMMDFDVQNGSTIDVTNLGTVESKPLIVLTGVADSISFGDFTLDNLDGVVYIDCDNRVVYEINGTVKVNRKGDFSGTFPTLDLGSNEFSISGTITGTVNVIFNDVNLYK